MSRDEPTSSDDGVGHSLAFWQALAESVPDQIYRLDRTGTILFINRVVSPLRREDVVGSHWLSWVPEDQRPRLEAELAAVLADGKSRSYELEARGPDDAISVYASHLGPIVEGGVIVGAVLCARDVTQQRLLEAQLVMSDRLASMGTLAAAFAHEINNPLACVILNLAMLERHVGETTDSARATLCEAREAATRVQNVVRDVMSFARGSGGIPTAVHLVPVLESTLRLCSNETRYKARVTTRYESVPPVAANESRLGQVFLNLIINASRAIEAGAPDKNEITIVVRADGAERVAVEIRDTGRGMDESVRRKLFTPFFTTKPVGEGTGLGLSISHRIVTTFGGHISVRSRPGVGSTFTVFLPIAGRPATGEQPHGAAAPITSPRRRSVLLIDDDRDVTTAVARALGADFDVTTMHRADEALELLQRGATFDAIVCDVMMPHMSGTEFHAALARNNRTEARHVVFLSGGGAFNATSMGYLDALPNLRIAKPFDIEELISAVDACASARSTTAA